MIWGKLGYAGRLFRQVLPQVDAELEHWSRQASQIPDAVLRGQALASIRHKRFHCEGGATFALFARGEGQVRSLVRLIVALQTISDYLDNLCDRSTSLDTRDYRMLHYSMLDAVTPGGPLPPAQSLRYYSRHPHQDDGGYLHKLVTTCRDEISRLPGYHVAAPHVWRLVRLYSDLQVLKHAPKDRREQLLRSWHRRHRDWAGDIEWYEFCAAAGSTLAMFALFSLAGRGSPDPVAVQDLLKAYFPWVCGLHIMLDYWIDQEEDRVGDDLNFVEYYGSQERTSARLRAMLKEALRRVRRLPDGRLHETIVQGLPGLYLSDPKAMGTGMMSYVGDVIDAAGTGGRVIFAVCRMRHRWGRRPQLQRPPLVPRI